MRRTTGVQFLRALGHGATAFILASALVACGGGSETGVAAPQDSAKTIVFAADGSSVSFRRPASSESGSAPTVRVAQDATGAPPIPAMFASLGPVYQVTPLGAAYPGTSVRIHFDQKLLHGGSRPRLLVAQPEGEWLEVEGARVDGSTVVAEVPQFAYATVAIPADEAAGASQERSRALSASSAPARLSLSVDPSTAPALPAPTKDGYILVKDQTQLALQVAYALPSNCTGTPKVRVYGIFAPKSKDHPSIKTVELANRTIAEPTGAFVVTQALGASENGAWTFASAAYCTDKGARIPKYALLAAGPVLSVDVAAAGAAPLITQAPQNTSVVEGASVTLAATASGSNLQYQWQRSGDGGATYVPVGTNSNTITQVASIADNGSLWRVTVSNPAGSVTSMPALLSVTPRAIAPTVTSDPSSQSVVEGETASFTVSGSGSPVPTIAWQRRPPNSTDDAAWVPIPDATGTTLTTAPTVLSESGTQFRAVLTNSAGSAASLPATLTVQAQPTAPAIATGPVSLSVPAGQAGAFAVTATGTGPLNYQWFQDGEALAGENASSTLIVASAADVGKAYQIAVEVSNALGSVRSSATLTVLPPAPSTSADTMVSATDGGVAAAAVGDASLTIPAGALASDTLIQVSSAQAERLTLPTGLTALSDAFEVGPRSVAFLTPATFSWPSPDSVPDGKELVLVQFEPGSSLTSGSRAKASALNSSGRANLRRIAQAFSGRSRIFAGGTISTIQCLGSANKVGGRIETLVSGATNMALAAADPSACSGTAPAAPADGIPSTQEDPCNDAQYAPAVDGTSATLVSRHVSCQFGVGEVALVDPSGTGDYGNFRLEMRLGTFGPARQLDKSYRMQFRMTRLSQGSLPQVPQITLRPQLSCASQEHDGSCVQPPRTLAISPNGNWTPVLDVKVTFNWNGGDGTLNTFVFNPVNVAVAVASQSLDQANVVSFSGPPNVRCDKKLSSNPNSSGCILPDAAAVLVYSLSDPTVREAAEHIKEAWQKWSSPGEFTLAPGTRAIAAGGSPLQYSKESGVENRRVACQNSDSLFNVRLPRQVSASCRGSEANCSCDEYPFAQSWNGAKFSPDTTSVKSINDDQNKKAGRIYGSFLQTQRVLDLSQPGSNDKGNSDNFWVKIR